MPTSSIFKIMTCNLDVDCPNTLMCFSESSWSINLSGCHCSSWYGWQGIECDSISGGSAILLSFTIFSFILGFVLLGCSIYALYELAQLRQHNIWNPTNVTGVTVFLSVLSNIIWRLLSISIILSPGNNTYFFNGKKLHQLLPYEKGFAAWCAIFSIVSAMNISIMWLDIADKSARFTIDSKSIFHSKLYRIVYSLEVAFVVSAAIGALLARMELTLIMCIIFISIGIATYSVGYIKLGTLLFETGRNDEDFAPRHDELATRHVSVSSLVRMSVQSFKTVESDGTRNRYYKQLVQIQVTSRLVISSFILTLIACLVYVVASLSGGGWRERCTPGGLCITGFSEVLLSFFVLSLDASIVHFIILNTWSRNTSLDSGVH